MVSFYSTMTPNKLDAANLRFAFGIEPLGLLMLMVNRQVADLGR
jgi:hypothetical protein